MGIRKKIGNFCIKMGILIGIFGCDNAHESSKRRLHTGSRIQTTLSELMPIMEPLPEQIMPVKREPYPWETASSLAKITKEYLRCKGSPAHLERKEILADGKSIEYWDCGGIDRHTLPVREQKEFVYQVLLDLLNTVQDTLQKRVIVTCGHRCPEHNIYADSSAANRTSKHQMGAEVDFFVEGMENNPIEVVRIIMEYYNTNPDKEYHSFSVCQTNPLRLAHPGWFNKEVMVRIFQRNEGRDFDNRHPYPYVSLQVRYDRERDVRVDYNWKEAHDGYMRH